MKGHWETYKAYIAGPPAELEHSFLCEEENNIMLRYWLINIKDTSWYRLWRFDEELGRYVWTEWEPVPCGLTLEEAKSYTMLMWRLL